MDMSDDFQLCFRYNHEIVMVGEKASCLCSHEKKPACGVPQKYELHPDKKGVVGLSTKLNYSHPSNTSLKYQNLKPCFNDYLQTAILPNKLEFNIIF